PRTRRPRLPRSHHVHKPPRTASQPAQAFLDRRPRYAQTPQRPALIDGSVPHTYIGRPMPRLEDPRFLRGQGQYTDDFVKPDQTYAAFVRSPHAHARIKSIRLEQAANAPVVVLLLTGQDYLDDGCQGI